MLDEQVGIQSDRDYLNKSCMLARRGIKPYRRCDYCKLKTVNCLGIQNNIIAIAIVIISLLFLFIDSPLYIRITIAVIACLLVVLGFKINTNLDDLATSERKNNQLNVQLTEHSVNLESQVKERTQELEKMAIYDGLTGLVNRQEFEKRLEKILQQTSNRKQNHVLCFLDLDRFKIVNDTCGHLAGDELLRQLVPILMQHIRETDTVARVGGDEFGILLMNCSIDEAKNTTERIRKSIEDFHFVWLDTIHRIGISIGVIGIHENSGDVIDIIAGVDDACYKAKELGRNRIHVYEEDSVDLRRKHGEKKWVSRLQHALDQDKFVLHYQPIFPLTEKEEKQHYEVLLRLVEYDGEIISPMTFIPVAERFNLMSKIDRWVIRNSFISQKIIEKDFPVILSINLSGASLTNDGLHDFIRAELSSSGADPRNIIFEITETTAIGNLGNALDLINDLKSLGIRFSLDDFGSGLSSFRYLKNLPVDYLKIDGGFVRDMLYEKSNMDIVSAMNQISHTMGKKTIAEFVESEQIRDALVTIGVDYAQGNGLGLPQPLEDILTSS